MKPLASLANAAAAPRRVAAAQTTGCDWCVWEAMVMCPSTSMAPSLPREMDGRARCHGEELP